MKARRFDVTDTYGNVHPIAATAYEISDGFVVFYVDPEKTDAFYRPVSVIEVTNEV